MMAEKYFPFESVSDDREYYASDFAAFYADIISNGISKRSPGGLKVGAGSGMNVTVSTGVAWIEGHIYHNTTSKTLALNIGGSKPRIDRIVVRLDNVARTMTAMVVNGTEANVPTAPALRRDGDVYEIGLATVRVPASAISVSASNITDTTGDPNICGAVAIMGAEDVINKVTNISAASNDTQYPTAKAVYALFAQIANSGVGSGGKIISDVNITWTASDGRYLGDCNGDGVIDNADMVQFSRYLTDFDTTDNFSIAAADLNGDGVADNADMIIFSRLMGDKAPEKIICRVNVKYTDNTSGVFYGVMDKPGTASGGGGGSVTDGVGISNIAFKETAENGDNVYTITLTNGVQHDFAAPKGADGVGIAGITFKETDAGGNNIYLIQLSNGRSFEFAAPRGRTGNPGDDGGFYLPRINNGVLSWQASKFSMPNAAETDIMTPLKNYIDSQILGGAW